MVRNDFSVRDHGLIIPFIFQVLYQMIIKHLRFRTNFITTLISFHSPPNLVLRQEFLIWHQMKWMVSVKSRLYRSQVKAYGWMEQMPVLRARTMILNMWDLVTYQLPLKLLLKMITVMNTLSRTLMMLSYN